MDKYVKLLELDQILQRASEHAVMIPTKRLFDELVPLNDITIIEELLTETEEAVRIVLRFSDAPIYFDSDIAAIAKKASKGAVLAPQEIYDIVRMNQTIKANEKLLETINNNKMTVECYAKYVGKFIIHQPLHKRIVDSIDPYGEILDSASPELKAARSKIKNLEKDIRSRMQEIVTKHASMLSQGIITIRNDRLVVPVKQEYKNVFKGIIHDESASGETVFMEPSSVYEKNNDLNRAKEDVKKEEYRVLRQLSLEVGENSEVILNNFLTIVDLDFIFAKAKYAMAITASKPKTNNVGFMDILNARHPLLKVKKVVSNSVTFGKGYHGIIITGPNTGGKTVLLKTVGLIALMVKCGLLVPCDEMSDVMIYDQVFSDIGDEQSIGQNLSTFSSHMTNIIHILNHITPNSLVLLDEVGSGTDPKEGSSLAIAILDYLLSMNVMFIVTTHYSELKAYAYNSEKVINASVEFNVETLSPTYKLLLGVPGQSNAYKICASLGLYPSIIEQASNYASISDSNIQTMISKLEHQSLELEKKLKTIEEEKQKYIKTNETLNIQLKKQDEEKTLLFVKAKKEAEEMVEKVTAQAKQVLNEIEELKNKEVKLHEIAAVKFKLKNIEIESPIEEILEEEREYVVGDFVFIETYNQSGVIKQILKNNRFQVQIGNIFVKLNRKQLKLAKEPVFKAKIERVVSQTSVKIDKSVSLSLDLRGERYEDALIRLERYLDDCLVANYKQVTIVHGHGTGVIREMVQNVLKTNKSVKSFRYGAGGEGGVGATIVNFK